MRIFLFLCLVLPSASAFAQSGNAPTDAEQQEMLDRLRQSATRYLRTLPNFVCNRVTEQFESGKKPEHWKRGETLTARLIFNQGKEDIKVELVNGKAIPADRWVNRPLETSGEFGNLLNEIIDSKSAAQISWSHWETISGRRLAVFDYVIGPAHSNLKLEADGLYAMVPFRGSLYTDPATGDLWRITSAPFDMPPTLDTKSLVTKIDYGTITISGKTYVLPVSATVLLDTGRRNTLNKISFTEYRKFETESKITFESSSH